MKYILIMTAMLFSGCAMNTDNGIHAHPSGEACYLEGEAIVINATPDLNATEVQELYVWAYGLHLEYLDGLTE